MVQSAQRILVYLGKEKDKMSEKALKESIQHWKENLEAAENGQYENITLGVQHCALCVEYFVYEDTCVNCPIYKETNSAGCKFTPYEVIPNLLFYHNVLPTKSSTKSKLIEAIKDEIAFLESLL